MLAENPRKQHSKSKGKMLPWCVLAGLLTGGAFNTRELSRLAVPRAAYLPPCLQRVCRACALHRKLLKTIMQAFEVHGT